MYSNIKETLEACESIHSGEIFFGLTCGRVSNTYINLRRLYSYPIYLKGIASMLMNKAPHCTVVAGATTEASPLIWECAEAVSKHYSVDFGLRAFCLCPDYPNHFADYHTFEAAVRYHSSIVVDGACSTGRSLQTVQKLIEDNGGTVKEFRLIWNRNPKQINQSVLGIPVTSLISEEVPSYAPEEHPHWGTWPLVTDVGHPEFFPDYSGPRITIL